MLIFSKIKVLVRKTLKSLIFSVSWFFEPFVLMAKKIYKIELISKIKASRGFYFFNLREFWNRKKIFSKVSLSINSFVFFLKTKKKQQKKLKESQKNYQELVENINDVIFHLDNNGKIIYISPAIRRVAGYDPKEVIGRSFKDFIIKEDYPEAENKLKLALSGIMRPRELKIIKKDGTIAHISSFGRPLIRNGKLAGVVSVLTDISERKKAEENLLESYKYLGTVNRQFSVLLNLNKALEEKNEKKELINSIAWSALEISSSKLAAIYEYQKEKHAFRLLSAATINGITEDEKSKIFHLTIVSSHCQEKMDEFSIRKIENIEDCFKESKLVEFKQRKHLKSFSALPIMNKDEMKGMILLGFSKENDNLANNGNFYDFFSKYIGFILLDKGIFK